MEAQEYIDDYLNAHNKIRTDPQSFIPILEEKLTMFDGNNLMRPGRPTLITKEGPKAVKEAIRFLESVEPVHELTLSQELCSSAQDHAEDLGKNGARGHSGTDGSSVSERMARYCKPSGMKGENISYKAGDGKETVLRLVVDDGVSSRGHRDNVFETRYNYMGVGFHDHPTWDNCVVLDYAGGISKGSGDYKPKKSPGDFGKYKVHLDESSKDYDDPNDIPLEMCPKQIQDQIRAMGLTDNYKIKLDDGTYKIEYTTGGCPMSKQKKDDFGTSKFGDGVGDFGDFDDFGSKGIDDFKKKMHFGERAGFDDDDFGGFGSKMGGGLDHKGFGDFGSGLKGFGHHGLGDDGFGDHGLSSLSSSHGEPAGYTSKSVSTKTNTCGGKKTVKTTTTYTFPDGSTQTRTETVNSTV
ncbi:unnamed protein product [Moneuplotes crassus]|uniref:SCP domain-containing protein n=1 Tax=Euplotes crassus TaxID=5936 RepID=A0AAD1UL64_EUPCR|nr:unnamed protein product [Moneuplotes crassus]